MMAARRQYYVKPFQLQFGLRFLGVMMLALIVMGVGLYAWSGDTITTAFENSRLVVKTTADFILPTIVVMTAMTVVVVGVATVFWGIWLTHRVAGPLYRVEQDLALIGEGDLSHVVVLRANDEIKELAKSVNDMSVSLKKHIEEIKKDIKNLEQVDKKLEQLWYKHPTSQDDTGLVICEFKEVFSRIKRNVGIFKTK